MNCSESQIPGNRSLFVNQHWQLSRPSCKYRVTQKLKNSSVVYRKTKDPFWEEICMNTSFQMLLNILKVRPQEDQ